MGLLLSTPARQLLSAARQGDLLQVDSLLQQDPQLIKSCTFFRQSTVLHLAANNNLPDLISSSLAPFVAAAQQELQANCPCGPALQQLRRLVDAQDTFQCTPLLTAAKRGSVPCARALAERAANLVSEDRDGSTVLHLAAFHGHTAAVKYLLDKTRSGGVLHRLLNRRNLAGFTALHCAAWGGHAAVVQLLLDADASCLRSSKGMLDAYMPAPAGSIPLHLAAHRGHVEVALVLLEHYALHLLQQPATGRPCSDPRGVEDARGSTPSQAATEAGYTQLALLLDGCVPIDTLFPPEQLQPAGGGRQVPPPLKDIASRALQRRLLASLEDVVSGKPKAGSAASSSSSGDGQECVAAQAQQQMCHMCSNSNLHRSSTSSSSGTSSGSSNGWGSPGCGGRLLSCCRPSDSFDSLQRLESSGTATAARLCKLPGMGCAYSASCPGPGCAALEATLEREGESDLEEGDEECGLCLDGPARVGLAPCRHSLCAACARQLVSMDISRPPACPFCRVHISGFQAAEVAA